MLIKIEKIQEKIFDKIEKVSFELFNTTLNIDNLAFLTKQIQLLSIFIDCLRDLVKSIQEVNKTKSDVSDLQSKIEANEPTLENENIELDSMSEFLEFCKKEIENLSHKQ
jgi:hypothetical protein